MPLLSKRLRLFMSTTQTKKAQQQVASFQVLTAPIPLLVLPLHVFLVELVTQCKAPPSLLCSNASQRRCQDLDSTSSHSGGNARSQEEGRGDENLSCIKVAQALGLGTAACNQLRGREGRAPSPHSAAAISAKALTAEAVSSCLSSCGWRYSGCAWTWTFFC